VYVTDVKSAGSSVTGVQIPDNLNIIADDPIVELKSARNPTAAKDFINVVLSAQGQQGLKSYGFIPVR
jgi:molybdate transport system substrate-binding protein